MGDADYVSYIRSTSSPEGLYAYSTKSDKTGRLVVEIIPKWGYKLTNVNNDNPMTVPQAVFDKAVKLWSEVADEEVGIKHKGFSVREVHVHPEDGAPVKRLDVIHGLRSKKGLRAEFMVRVAYRGKWMLLWRVTWAYVVHNALDRDRTPKRKRTKARSR